MTASIDVETLQDLLPRVESKRDDRLDTREFTVDSLEAFQVPDDREEQSNPPPELATWTHRTQPSQFQVNVHNFLLN